jgi:hypothetical protein
MGAKVGLFPTFCFLAISKLLFCGNSTLKYRLSTTDTAKLPRWLLFVLLVLYLLLGFVDRDPWKYDDAVGFGITQAIVQQGGGAWFHAQVAGVFLSQISTFTFWPNAALYHLFSWTGLSSYFLSALGTLCWGGMFFFLLRKACFAWALLPENQPERLPFGGQPSSDVFATTLADGVFLLSLSTLGWVTRFHEISAFAAQMSFTAVLLWALARLVALKRYAFLALVFSWLGLALTHSYFGAALSLCACWGFCLVSYRKKEVLVPLLGASFCFGVLLGVDTLCSGNLYFSAPRTHSVSLFGWDFMRETLMSLANFAWVAWPVWFLTLIFVLLYRSHLGRVQRGFLGYLGGFFIVSFFFDTGVVTYLFLLIPPLLFLAVFSLPFVRRSILSLLDSFAFVCFSLLILFVWLGWLAIYTGYPTGLARSAAKWVPGFYMPTNYFGIALAILLTVVWVVLVIWRLRWHPRVLWRGVVLSAAGVTVVWGLINTLWLPAINFSRSYQDLAISAGKQFAKLQANASSPACVATEQLDLPQRAIFAYVGQMPLALEVKRSQACEFLLIQDNLSDRQDDSLPKRVGSKGRWVKVWEDRRVAESNWRYRLYRWRNN